MFGRAFSSTRLALTIGLMTLSPRVPRSVARTSRTEHTALPFAPFEGAVPGDLSGHLFVVAPASTFRPPPPSQRPTIMVGDGMVCRFDLDPSGVTMTSRLARTHDFVADEITSARADLSRFRFETAGIVRLGLLGTRDFSNTALVPMKRGADPTRMLLTYDAGRPWELDPVSLELRGPVGRAAEWRPEALRNQPFPVYLSPAHPVWDRRTGELFTVNYGRGVANFAATIPFVYALTSLPGWAYVALERIAAVAGIEAALRWVAKRVGRRTTAIDRSIEQLLDAYFPDVPDTFTDLVRWDGTGALERFRHVQGDDREVGITQSVHQIAVTRDHVVVLHTGFKIGFASAFNDPIPKSDVADRLLRAALTRPQLPTTALYVVPRAELDRADLPVGADGVRRVRCARVELPLETDHFLADYDDAGGAITLHLAHSPATDLAEWIRPYDESPWGGAVAADLHGMLAVGAMDVGRFGRYVIDARSGAVLEAKTMLDDRHTWAISLYAGAALNTEDALPERIGSVFWCTVGFFPEFLTDFVFDLYERYPHRATPVSEILRMRQGGRPSCILRVDTGSVTIADRYALPEGVIAGSVQLVPGGGAGYLVGTFYTDARTELWILDAGDLARGPICKLAAPGFELGFSLHTAWLPALEAPASTYRVTAKSELALRVEDRELARAFEQDLYPRFE